MIIRKADVCLIFCIHNQDYSELVKTRKELNKRKTDNSEALESKTEPLRSAEINETRRELLRATIESKNLRLTQCSRVSSIVVHLGAWE